MGKNVFTEKTWAEKMQSIRNINKWQGTQRKAHCNDGGNNFRDPIEYQIYVVSRKRSIVQSQKNYVNWVEKEWSKGPKLADKLRRTGKEARPLDLASSQSLILLEGQCEQSDLSKINWIT